MGYLKRRRGTIIFKSFWVISQIKVKNQVNPYLFDSNQENFFNKILEIKRYPPLKKHEKNEKNNFSISSLIDQFDITSSDN